jgi:hypothetical protein
MKIKSDLGGCYDALKTAKDRTLVVVEDEGVLSGPYCRIRHGIVVPASNSSQLYTVHSKARVFLSNITDSMVPKSRCLVWTVGMAASA